MTLNVMNYVMAALVAACVFVFVFVFDSKVPAPLQVVVDGLEVTGELMLDGSGTAKSFD